MTWSDYAVSGATALAGLFGTLAVYFFRRLRDQVESVWTKLVFIEHAVEARKDWDTVRLSIPITSSAGRPDWTSVFTQAAMLLGDSYEMNTLRRTVGHIDGALQAANIPYELGTCFTDANDAFGLLDEAGRLRSRGVCEENAKKAAVENGRISYACVFKFSVPKEVEAQARNVVQQAITKDLTNQMNLLAAHQRAQGQRPGLTIEADKDDVPAKIEQRGVMKDQQ